jgi:endo-1,4-beta-D-glucanase Y
VTATDPSAIESGKTAIFTITLDSAPSSNVIVNYTAGGTATPGADYTALSGTATVSAGQTSAAVTVTPLDDAVEEDDETVVVTLSSGTGYTVGSSSAATVTIGDDDTSTDLSLPSRGYGFGRDSAPGSAVQSESSLIEEYRDWKALQVTSEGCPNPQTMLRVQKDAADFPNDPYATVSEGMGYGMLLALYFNDRTTFDRLYEYVKHYRDVADNQNDGVNGGDDGMMPWYINRDGEIVGEGGSATDGDQDIAVALALASKRWGPSDYAQEATDYINDLMTQCVTDDYYLKPGSTYGGESELDPSYFSTAWYRIYAAHTGDDRWYQVIEKCFEVSDNIRDSYAMSTQQGTSWLVPDWCNATGGAPADPTRRHSFWYDAPRYSWRMAIDYSWSGDERARAHANGVTNFFRGVGVANIVDGYDLNGTAYGTDHNAAQVAPVVAGAMNHPDFSFLSSGYVQTRLLKESGPDWTYYRNTLRLLSLVYMSGYFSNLYGNAPAGCRAVRWLDRLVGDFNGDDRSDVLLRNSTTTRSKSDNPTTLYMYQMNGKAIAGEGIVRRLEEKWSVEAIADFDGDACDDILLRDSASSPTVLYLYQMNGKAIAAEGIVRRLSSDWNILGVDDFSGDGRADILFRNDAVNPSVLYLYQMNGKTVVAEGIVRRLEAGWSVVAIDDFGGDGKADILLRNATTSPAVLYMYEMDGKTITAEGIVRRLETDWLVEHVADFSGDGKADILLRNNASEPSVLYLYQMDGKTITAEGIVRRVSGDWTVDRVADFDGDGGGDILLRNSALTPSVFYLYSMNGKAIASEGIVRRVSSDWVAQDVADFDGDGKADILLNKDSGDENILYLYRMDGKAIVDEGIVRRLSGDWGVVTNN